MKWDDYEIQAEGGKKRIIEPAKETQSQHEPGVKLDNGKPLAGLVLKGFATALTKVSQVGTFGANKYTADGWKSVEDGYNRYENALMRHLLKYWQGEEIDNESELTHLAHAAWNLLAMIEFKEDDNV